MWPKFNGKPNTGGFEPLYITGSDDESLPKMTSTSWGRLVGRIVTFVQLILLFFIILSLTKIAYILSRKTAVSYDGHVPAGEDRYFTMFMEFIQVFNKTYQSEQERSFRYLVFVKNVKDFEEEERKHTGLDLDVTRFADWTEEEMVQYLHGNQQDIRYGGPRFEGSAKRDGVQRPQQLDWSKAGKVTAVKDQGQCGSCWAFATVASVEAASAIKTGQLIRLSEQEMVDCDSQNNGCQGGYRPYAMNFVQTHGLMKEEDYPYCGTDHNSCRLKRDLERVFIKNYRMLSTNEDIIADWIAANGPATFGMNVTKAMYSYRSGVFSPSKEDCEKHSLGSHALTFIGYGTENGQPFWLVKNSWGSQWGQNGFFKLQRGQNVCGLANTVVGPIIV
ncbi:hypothetical protein Q1695_010678 [Nippostrongylus brasiliensis]|nr:hypothetical protein Q1695_010678 [Nippostrongylus brasiliensis]